MKSVLRIRIEIFDDDTAELHAEIEACGFSGRGSAWFQPSHLLAQARKFAQYPLVVGDEPSLIGGFWNKDATEIEDTHIHIAAYPRDNLGALALFVRLAVPRDNTSQSGSCSSVSVELNSNYEQMSMFARDLESLANGLVKEILFEQA
jgi:hypothetical protein